MSMLRRFFYFPDLYAASRLKLELDALKSSSDSDWHFGRPLIWFGQRLIEVEFPNEAYAERARRCDGLVPIHKVSSQHRWVDKLESLVPDVGRLKLRRRQDFPYVVVEKGKVNFEPDTYSFCNSSLHEEQIRRAIVHLLQTAGDKFVKNLLGELTFRKTYGAFSELAAYDWLAQSGISFTPQVPLGPMDVVNPNGSTLDGRFASNGKSIYFDIKAFGFVENLIDILRQRLESQAEGDEVVIEGGIHVSVDLLESLLGKDFVTLVNELANTRSAVRGSLKFQRRPRPRISVSAREVDADKLAVANRDYALGYGGQFARRAPFILFFVIHPWFSRTNLHQNFAGHTDRFCDRFSEQALVSFRQDTSIRESMQTQDLVKLLSAIGFINVWPEPGTRGAGVTARIYLNSQAAHPIVPVDLALLAADPQVAISQL